ncbi:hypothetical protein CMK12_06370 [Candidatus Poribacteria bacterium]|nr:hypothetical protein [Candidatus Poribacteria bacterium]MDP6595600.1 enolase C-terminal domain-like protein [Candidatus Poribacteria bacterium]MDP6748754.1 enolase C-terminal domain-like protein [Candidatus Poribacteria bacterium]MDP6961046.1 enolase C-terminal domain-like protein [Dehalococcoidia bacterium]
MKVRIDNRSAKRERLSIEIVCAVREVVGPNVDLCIEAHDRFTVTHAIRIGHTLEELQVMWLEAPVHSGDIEATIEVATIEMANAIAPVPVAVDERYKRMEIFVDLLATKVIDIVQPEVLTPDCLYYQLDIPF